MHARAFARASAAIASSSLPEFYANAARALWLIDSATLLVVAVLFGLLAARPGQASGAVIVLVALIPAATSGFLYAFMGAFLPAHMLLAAALMAALAGILVRRG